MKLLISHMRAGSHLAAAILKLRPFVAHNEQTGKMIPVEELIAVISAGYDMWTYYPYHRKLERYLIVNQDEIEPYLLLRDPRDIIVSTAHFCEKYPNTFLNFEVDGRKFSDMGLEERIDHLIDDILEESLFDYEKWRTSGLFNIIHYRDLIKHPIADFYQNWKRRGVTGSYKDEMTRKQIRRATQKYKELIEKWA